MSASVYRLCFLLVPLLLCSDSIQPIHSQAVADHDDLLKQHPPLGVDARGGGEARTAPERSTPAGGKPSDARHAAGRGTSTGSTASSSSSSSLDSLWNDWMKQPAQKLYQKAKPLVLDLVKKPNQKDDLELQRPVEQYEILGMWRLSLNDGDDIAFLEIRPHDLSYGKKHRVSKYTFQQAKTAADQLLGGGGGGEEEEEQVPAVDDDGNKKKDSSSSSSKRAKTKRVAAKIANKIAPVSSTIRFERDNRLYIAKLTRRRIDVEEDESSQNIKEQSQKKKKKTVLKITGRIMENKHSSWWWPKRKLGTFAGIKLAYRELSREQAQIWNGQDEEPDLTVTKDASSSSVMIDADDWDQNAEEL
jgi:hypothetical protein